MRLLHWLDDFMQRLAWIPRVVLLAALALVLIQASDREPPFHLLSVEPAAARPGELVTITAHVRRDTARDCSASMSRSVFDSAGRRTDYPVARFSDALIDGMERKTPGLLKVSIVVPTNAAVGPAEVVSVLDYRCNRVHHFFPVEVTTVMPFEVLP